MRTRGIIGLALLVCLALSGCTSATQHNADGTVKSSVPTPEARTRAPAPAQTPTPVPAAIIVSVDGLALLNSDGSTAESARFDDTAATIAFLTAHLGGPVSPMPHPAGYGFAFYDWTAAHAVIPQEGSASVSFTASVVNGLAVRTSNGISVGTTKDEALAKGATDPEANSAWDYLQFDARPVPGTESLQNPGQLGSEFVDLEVKDGAIATILAPGNDYSDL